jgi:hypothetical protein
MTFMNVPREESSKGHYTGTHLRRDDERFGIPGAIVRGRSKSTCRTAETNHPTAMVI